VENSSNNLQDNKFGFGVTEGDILRAVNKSGFPFQSIVANVIKKYFGNHELSSIQEEWSYIDKDTTEIRTIDIFAEIGLWDYQKQQPRVRPTVNLLVECKKSDLPYVFFLSSEKQWIPHFPIFAGLSKDEVEVITDDDASSWKIRLNEALGLNAHPFIEQPKYCTSFSKCIRNGKELDLSNPEPYQKLVLPILKAMHHFKRSESPVQTAFYFDCHMIIGIGVIDAPMVGVKTSDQQCETILLPWVRVIRHEPEENVGSSQWSKIYAIDIVQKNYFSKYLDEYLLPFADDFSIKVIKHQKELLSGQGFISKMNVDWVSNIEQRLRPVRAHVRARRIIIVLNNILRFLIGRKPIGE
jgi:hypothetical protein